MQSAHEVAPSHAGQWSSLPIPLSTPILAALASFGFEQMTPVQSAAIPLFLRNKDVVVEAVTGSGKTLAFVIPLIERLLQQAKVDKQQGTTTSPGVSALIISPTRELARQIHQVIESFTPFFPEGSTIRSQLIIGGSTSSAKADVLAIRERCPAILVGTPGRMEELIVAGAGRTKALVGVRQVDAVVLDEADRLLDMGFAVSIGKIITALPKQRRTALFSATMTEALGELVRAGLRNPTRIVVRVEGKGKGGGAGAGDEGGKIPTALQIGYILCAPEEKLAQVCRLLEREPNLKYILYTSTCAEVEYFSRVLARLPRVRALKATIHALHGQMDAKRREGALAAFTIEVGKGPSVLVCTDVAARGLDIPDVDRVIQYDAPQDPKVFAHRCGRTGRAGRAGRALVLLNRGREEVYVEFLRVRKIPMIPHPYVEEGGGLRALTGEEEEEEKEAVPEDVDARTLTDQVRTLATQDRDLYEKGIKAFVSHIQSYSKHEASYIFRIKDLNLGGLATGFGLIRLPRMPELKGLDVGGWVAWEGDVQGIRYADKGREKQRQGNIQAKAEAIANGTYKEAEKRGRKTEAWSKKKEAKAAKAVKAVKRERKREWKERELEEKIRAEVAGEKRDAPEGEGGDDNEDDWAAMEREERLVKKMRKGKIGKGEFEKLMAEEEAELGSFDDM